MSERGYGRTLQGVVVSDKADKTITVEVTERFDIRDITNSSSVVQSTMLTMKTTLPVQVIRLLS